MPMGTFTKWNVFLLTDTFISTILIDVLEDNFFYLYMVFFPFQAEEHTSTEAEASTEVFIYSCTQQIFIGRMC